MREAYRVVKLEGAFIIVAEVYRGGGSSQSKFVEKNAHKVGMTLLTPEQHRALLAGAGFANVEVFTEPGKGWVCAIGHKIAHP